MTQNPGQHKPRGWFDAVKKSGIANRLRSIGLKATSQRILIFQEIAHPSGRRPLASDEYDPVIVACKPGDDLSRPVSGAVIHYADLDIRVILRKKALQARSNPSLFVSDGHNHRDQGRGTIPSRIAILPRSMEDGSLV